MRHLNFLMIVLASALALFNFHTDNDIEGVLWLVLAGTWHLIAAVERLRGEVKPPDTNRLR